MNRKEIYWLVGGLALGLIVGILLAASGAIPGPGSAVQKADKYYIAQVSNVAAWLTEEYAEAEEVSAALTSAIEDISGFVDPDTMDIQAEFLDAKTSVDTMLVSLHGALAGEKITNLDTVEALAGEDAIGPSDKEVSVCLALDDDPYAERPLLYVYVTVPEDKEGSIDIPNTKDEEGNDVWESLDEPKTTDLFWLLLNCYFTVE